MAGNVINAAAVNAAIAADALNLKTDYWQWKRWYAYFNGNYSTPAQLQAAGVSVAADQAQIQAVTGDINWLILLVEGNAHTSATNLAFDFNAGLVWQSDPNWLKQAMAGVCTAMLSNYWRYKDRWSVWNTNANSAAKLTTAGVIAGDQPLILTVIADFNRLITVIEGGIQAVGQNILNDCNAVLGVS